MGGMDGAAVFRRVAAGANRAMLPLLRTGPAQRLLGSSFATLTYTGRKSGREITLPVNYRRDKATGDVVILVAVPSAKTWWRNFTGDGAPVLVTLGAEQHRGHAVATKNAKGGVSVRVSLS